MRKPDGCGLPAHFVSSENEKPYYDETAGAWVFSCYTDVLSGLLSNSLVPSSIKGKTGEEWDVKKIRSTRIATQKALSRDQLRLWYDRLESEAQRLAGSLPVGQPVDLLAAFARPLCLKLAIMVTKVDPREAKRIMVLAKHVSDSAAEPYDLALKEVAAAAHSSFQASFPSGPKPLRDSGFVSLSHTLPCLLGHAWLALLRGKGQWEALHLNPASLRFAVEELLRHAEIPRVLFRTATSDFEIGDARVRKGELVVLHIMAANHDQNRFPNPEHVEVRRRRVKHFTLGAGPHSCVAGNLVRMAMIAISRPLVERFSHATLDRPVEFKGGSGFRFPTSVWVLLNNNLAAAAAK